tara:strand:- start:438 stop:596 length:159 start_codon:yes stop_codon:yes gene_type:complete
MTTDNDLYMIDDEQPTIEYFKQVVLDKYSSDYIVKLMEGIPGEYNLTANSLK